MINLRKLTIALTGLFVAFVIFVPFLAEGQNFDDFCVRPEQGLKLTYSQKATLPPGVPQQTNGSSEWTMEVLHQSDNKQVLKQVMSATYPGMGAAGEMTTVVFTVSERKEKDWETKVESNITYGNGMANPYGKSEPVTYRSTGPCGINQYDSAMLSNSNENYQIESETTALGYEEIDSAIGKVKVLKLQTSMTSTLKIPSMSDMVSNTHTIFYVHPKIGLIKSTAEIDSGSGSSMITTQIELKSATGYSG